MHNMVDFETIKLYEPKTENKSFSLQLRDN